MTQKKTIYISSFTILEKRYSGVFSNVLQGGMYSGQSRRNEMLNIKEDLRISAIIAKKHGIVK